MDRSLVCKACVKGPLCINGKPVVEMQHSDCPKGHWSREIHSTWLCGDLAYGGITNFIRTLLPLLSGTHKVYYASDFQLDQSAASRLSAVHSAASPVLTPAVPFTGSPLQVVHLVSRHPEHTPLSSAEKLVLKSAQHIIIHAHGTGEWAQECIDYSLSLIQSNSVAPNQLPSSRVIHLVCNSHYTLSHLRIPHHSDIRDNSCPPPFPLLPIPRVRVIPLPISIHRSPYSRLQDRENLRELYPKFSGKSSHPAILDLRQPIWLYCGRNSPEKRLDDLRDLAAAVSRNGYVTPQILCVTNNPKQGTFHLPWRSDLSRIYNAADFTVCLSETEGGPIFTVEALLHGCPVISTEVGHMVNLPHYKPDPCLDVLNSPPTLSRTQLDIHNAFLVAPQFDPRNVAYQWQALYAPNSLPAAS